MSRPYIRVTPDGSEIARDLMSGNHMKMAGVSHENVCDLIIAIAQHMRDNPRAMLITDSEHGRIDLSYADQVEFGMQAFSSLRY